MEKTKLVIPLAGLNIDVEIREINIDDLVLDEENPRLGYWMDNVLRVKEGVSQNDLALALRAGNLDEYNSLKHSVEFSEGIMQEIWVYPINGGKYRVIDGNTRVLIYRDLRDKYPHRDTYRNIRSKVLPSDIDEKTILFVKLISHLFGVNDWEVYDRARLLYILWEQRGYTEEELRNETKLSLSEIRKMIAAYKDMNEQFLPAYSTKPDALTKFSYFVEYENRTIKEGMRRHNLTIRDFCEWVGEGEIQKAQDVRDLKKMFGHEEIIEILKEEGFRAAVEQLGRVVPGYQSALFYHMEECTKGLKRMQRSEEESIIKGDEPAKQEQILDLYEELSKIEKRIRDYG